MPKTITMSNREVRVRFAPSPTGPLHIGGVRTALYNYLFAKKNNGTFLIRIEDTDQTRFVPGAQDYIMEALNWCGIIPTEGPGIGGDYGPYVQSERKEMYRPYAEQLVANGKAYYAFDTPEELEAQREAAKNTASHTWQYDATTRLSMKNSLTLSAEDVAQRIQNGEPYVIRMQIVPNEEIHFVDMIRGEVTVNSSNLDDKVLFKSDGMPTYHLANIVDDYTMNISHVIRGEEWLPSAPMHILLYRNFGWEAPEFAHLPLLLRPDGNGKLSKRDGDRLGFPVFPLDWHTAEGEKYTGYREEGYIPEAFINMLAFLGWNPGTEQEIFSMKELEEAFSLERVNKAGAKFDADKTKWFQQQYLRHTDNTILATELKNSIETPLSVEKLATICHLMKERVTFLKEIPTAGSFLFATPEHYDFTLVSKKWKENTTELVNGWKNVLTNENTFTAPQLDTVFKSYIEQQGVGIGQVMLPFRYVLTAAASGPDIFEIAAFLGKEECLKRFELGLKSAQND